MIKKVLYVILLCLSVQLQVGARELSKDALMQSNLVNGREIFNSVTPILLNEVVAPSAWSSNWFFNLSGGVTAFAGKPLGCEDLFGRLKPSLMVSIGKWFIPTIGSRITFQGFQLKDYQLASRNYQSIHSDLLWNASSHFYRDKEHLKWNLIPYAGLGLLRNRSDRKYSFAFSYGMLGQYGLSKRIHLTMELSGTTTFSNFDEYGDSRRLGDNLFNLTIGLALNIGKVGWKRVIDVQPYRTQNEWLFGYANSLVEKNSQLNKQHSIDANVISQLKKIVETEGLLGRYQDKVSIDASITSTSIKEYPKNDYSGLNSLYTRLANRSWNGFDTLPTNSISVNKLDSVSWNTSLSDMISGIVCLGSPVYFFFKMGTSELTGVSQLVNIDELARVAQKYELRIIVTGAADSHTGTAEMNDSLSISRADYISRQLAERGIDTSIIDKCGVGGINTYNPTELNRHTKVCLYYK